MITHRIYFGANLWKEVPGPAPWDRPQMAMDQTPTLAIDEATIDRMVARAMRATLTTGNRRSTSTKETKMRTSSRRFDVDKLLQRSPDDRDLGPAFAAAWAARNTPPGSRKPRAHALDAELDHAKALKELEGAKDHIEAVQTGYREYDPKHFARFLRNAWIAMGAEGPEGDEEREDDAEYDASGMPVPTDRAKAGGDSDPDHRKDFNSLKQGGAHDSAHFDPTALFQR